MDCILDIRRRSNDLYIATPEGIALEEEMRNQAIQESLADDDPGLTPEANAAQAEAYSRYKRVEDDEAAFWRCTTPETEAAQASEYMRLAQDDAAARN